MESRSANTISHDDQYATHAFSAAESKEGQDIHVAHQCRSLNRHRHLLLSPFTVHPGAFLSYPMPSPFPSLSLLNEKRKTKDENRKMQDTRRKTHMHPRLNNPHYSCQCATDSSRSNAMPCPVLSCTFLCCMTVPQPQPHCLSPPA